MQQINSNSSTQLSLAQIIDHTHIKADATEKEIDQLCLEAREYDFHSVCVNPYWVKKASSILKNSYSKVCTVIGFPLGANLKESKAHEVILAKSLGAQEFDMVLNIGALKDRKLEEVTSDIREVVKAASPYIVKVVIETDLLTETEIVTACQLARKAGAHFIRTSTDFSNSPVGPELIKLIVQTTGHELKVKACGNIHDRDTAIKLVEAGATRIGSCFGIAIVRDFGQ